MSLPNGIRPSRALRAASSPVHEWIVNDVTGLGESFDEEARSWLEAGAIGDLVQRLA